MIYINLNRENSLSLSKQIYNFIRESIFNGTLKEGEKLPSTRELAKYHNIARNVVIESYEQLMAEGYIYAKNGSGTYVAEGISFKRTNTHHYQSESKTPIKNLNEDIISFRTGIPELSSIPIKKMGKNL